MCEQPVPPFKASVAVILALVCLLAGAVIVGASKGRAIAARDASFHGGTLTQHTVLSTQDSPYVVTEDIIVPTGITLTIEPGVTLQFQANRSIQVKGGRILAEGTITRSIIFTRHGDAYWGGILLQSTQQDNRIRHAVIEYTKEAINYPRTHGVSAYDSRVTIADSVLRHTEASNAIIADWGSTLYLLRNEIYDVQGDAVHPTGGYALIQGNHIHDIRRGIYPLEGIEISHMVTPAVVTDNHVHDVSDDCLDLNHASAIIERNELHHCGDKGISIGHYPSVVTIVNNLIYECLGKDADPYSGTGIAVKDGAISHIVNNTVSDSRHGIYLYEGHQGQGGGIATVVNTIVWDNRSALDLDALSTVTVTHSDVKMDTGTWPGEGNINADPLFRAPQSGDYQLQQGSPCVDAGTGTDAPDEDILSVCRPHGVGYDMGAYELQDCFHGGTLTEDTTLLASCHPSYVISDDITVMAGVTLTVEPSVTLRFQTDRSLIVEGRLVAAGTSSHPVVFTRDGTDPWGGIVFQSSTADNLIRHAVVENFDIRGTLVPTFLLQTGINAYSSTLRVEQSIIHHLGGPALFSENSAVHMLDNVVHDVLTDGVHIVEGQAVLLGNHIHDISGDCLALNRSSAIIERNEVHHCNEAGISASQSSSATLVNNLIYATRDGVEITDGGMSRIVNNTVADNERGGIQLHQEHPGAGGGDATVVNSIVWGNQTDLEMDVFSTITVTYSDVRTFTGTVVLPGGENINSDPLFRDPQNGNYRLLEGSPCVDTGTPVGAPEEDIRGVYRPHGDGYDLGAHEFFAYFFCHLPVAWRSY
jgi:parallel beta-helix repeat protein